MTTAATQIAFRYRAQDSATGVTRTTAKRLAKVLGVDETQGQTPKLGTLHPSMVRVAASAFAATSK